MSNIPSDALLQLTSIIFRAYISGNAVPVADLPSVLRSVHGTLRALATGMDIHPPLKPAVSIKRSITQEYLICLEDGGRFKMLKRYLRARYDLTPEQYRTKWGLPLDYPMTAPNYAAQRAVLAKSSGLVANLGWRCRAARKRKPDESNPLTDATLKERVADLTASQAPLFLWLLMRPLACIDAVNLVPHQICASIMSSRRREPARSFASASLAADVIMTIESVPSARYRRIS